MKIGFLIIGSEILDGKITDLNTKILSEYLRSHHEEIHESMVVRDTKSDIEHGLRELFHTHDVVITSGGLGPTKDDITKETIASFFGKKIIFNPDALKISEDNYKRFHRTFPGKNHTYSYLPEDFSPLSNTMGFAPGFYTKHQNKFLFSAPGVPREFKRMIEDHLFHMISEKLEKKTFLKHVIMRTKYIPEEKIFQEVDTLLWDKLSHYGEVSSLPNLMGVDIGVKVRASSEEELEKKVVELHSIFEKSPLHKNIWGEGRETLEEKIIKLCNLKNIKFGFAESASGGLCSHRITGVPGSSQSFMGSVVCYDEKIKQDILGVKKETLLNHSAVSSETATEMAMGLLEKFHLDIALSITGYAGPGGGTPENSVGTVFIGKAKRDKTVEVQKLNLFGDREILKQRFSQVALFTLLEEAEKFTSSLS
jgi:nicotinamide-nucleotide amidase